MHTYMQTRYLPHLPTHALSSSTHVFEYTHVIIYYHNYADMQKLCKNVYAQAHTYTRTYNHTYTRARARIHTKIFTYNCTYSCFLYSSHNMTMHTYLYITDTHALSKYLHIYI